MNTCKMRSVLLVSVLLKCDLCGAFPVLIYILDLGINCVGTCWVSPRNTSLSSGGCVSDTTRLRTVEKGEEGGI